MTAVALLSSSLKFYSLMRKLETEYEEKIKRSAVKNSPLIATAITTTTTTTSSNIPSLRMPVKHDKKRVKPYRDKRIEVAATLRKINKLLDIKPPVTHGKIVKLLGIMDVPIEKYIAQRIDVMLRKYLTDKMKKFTENTFKKHFFNLPPPFKLTNTANVTWERDLKGLMMIALDSNGLVVRRPTERLKAIIRYCCPVINGAYKSLDDRDAVPGKGYEEAFVQRVAKYNGYASLINNISAIPRYNASSLVFTYFKQARWGVFDRVADTLSDIKRSSPDAERVLLCHILDVKVDDDTDAAVTNPYNVVSFGGYPYEQIRQALRAEYVVLKLVFYLGATFGFDATSTYRQAFMTNPTAVDNVLQLYPGLMTVMFYTVNVCKDPEGINASVNLDHKLKVLTSSKGYFGSKQEAIELHKKVSGSVEELAQRCIDIFMTNPNIKTELSAYCNLLFLKSGLLRPAV